MLPPGERDALLSLSLTPGLGPTLINRCIEAFGSAEATLGASRQHLAAVQGIGPGRAEAIRRGMDSLSDGKALATEQELIARHGATVVTIHDESYPKSLSRIPDAPPVLYIRGQITDADVLSLAVVGARKCSAYGREQADRLSYGCAQAGLSIISGGAYGIDITASRAALRAGGRTLVVLGSGIADPYPADHIPVFDEVVNGRGAIISEFPMAMPPLPDNFLRRNRIISGLALGVLVVEAAARSGALSTARRAVDEHHREVMAVPGRIDSVTSAGCHKLIRDGTAALVTSVAEILETLGGAATMLQANIESEPSSAGESKPTLFEQNLTGSQRRVLEALEDPQSLDQISSRTGLAVHVIQSDLTMLQIRGLIERRNGVVARKR